MCGVEYFIVIIVFSVQMLVIVGDWNSLNVNIAKSRLADMNMAEDRQYQLLGFYNTKN